MWELLNNDLRNIIALELHRNSTKEIIKQYHNLFRWMEYNQGYLTTKYIGFNYNYHDLRIVYRSVISHCNVMKKTTRSSVSYASKRYAYSIGDGFRVVAE